MKERFNRVFVIVIFTELLLFCALVAYVQFQTNTYNFLAWVLICCSAVLINIAGYVFGILPYVQEVCNRVDKIQEVLREIDNHFNLMVEDNAEFENSINVLKNQLKILKVESQREDVFFEQYKEMIIPNVKLIYDMAKNKNDREIEGLAKSLLDIIDKSIYSRRTFVPLWYEVMCFQTILSEYVYSAMNKLEIVINIQEEELKQSLVLHGILTSVATLFIDCVRRQLPIKNIIQLSIINLSGHLSLRLYYNNTIQDLNKAEEVLNILKQRFSLYYPEGTYAVNYSLGGNHFIIEMSLPIIESFEK
ncbi:hypothetical protein [Caldicellulosiruptor sp. F32]|uniref:hypothetical protein n=1 Tax=Caldicellulosiruptor sp. F32 TaxID=1214564 RepID=UPI0003A9B59A|nr:hypothetical protein [Caldicellulosiruptor sp. F32]